MIVHFIRLQRIYDNLFACFRFLNDEIDNESKQECKNDGSKDQENIFRHDVPFL